MKVLQLIAFAGMMFVLGFCVRAGAALVSAVLP